MDYAAILKRSWDVTWRYKILWLFGLFAGAGGGYAGVNSNTGGTSNSSQGVPDWLTVTNLQSFAQRYAIVLLVAAIFLIVLALLLWILAVAARGGLIHLVNEAEEGREVHASSGWHAGFSKWWRVFGVSFLADLPVAILVVAMFTFIGVTAVGAAMTSQGSGQAITSAIGAAIIGLCLFAAVFIIAIVALGAILGVVKELASRYVVIEDRRVMDALTIAWRDLWAKRGAFVMYLIQMGVSIGYGVVVAFIAVVTMAPAVLMIIAGNVVGGVILAVLASLILMLPSAIYGTFYHAVWTIFFRRMTGAEQVVAAAAPVGYQPQPLAEPSVPQPPAEPSVPQAPAEPVVPQPPAAPAAEPPGPADD